MPTNRTRRSRLWAPDLDDYRRQELLEGPGAHLLAGVGYGSLAAGGVNNWTDQEKAKIREAMAADWARFGDELVLQWIGHVEAPSIRPWCFVALRRPGTRPWAWWAFSAPEAREPDETEADYLRRHKLLLRGETVEVANAD